MKKIVVGKRDQDGTVEISFRFKALGQLLLEEDQTPLPEKELTDEAEEAIAGHLDEYRVGKAASLVIELPKADLATIQPPLIAGAIHHHFGFRKCDLEHDMKLSLREGIYSLLISIGNAAFLVWFLFYITTSGIPVDNFNVTIFLGFLTVLNWVTIWDTYEHFVYDYRFLYRKHRMYGKISGIQVSVREY